MNVLYRHIAVTVFVVGCMGAMVSFCQVASNIAVSPRSPEVLPKGEAARLASFRYAALQGDRSQIPAMSAALKEKYPSTVAASMYALKELGATEALPDIEAATRQAPTQQLRNQAAAVRARIVADAAARSAPVPANRASVRVRRFLSEVGLSRAAINLQVASFKAFQGQAAPIGLFALWELADMAYRDPSVDYTQLTDMQGLDFSRDPGAALKMRLAAMPLAARVPWMVDTLAALPAVRTDDSYLMQLAADEGPAFARRAAAKLMQMDKNRSQYSRAGFTALFRAMAGTGDSTQAAVIEHFLHDKTEEGWIAYYAAQVYPAIKAGKRAPLATGY